MPVDYLDLLLKEKDEQIKKLTEENNQYRQKLLELVSPKSKDTLPIKRAMVFDEKEKKLREKTPEEASAEFKALQDLGILG